MFILSALAPDGVRGRLKLPMTDTMTPSFATMRDQIDDRGHFDRFAWITQGLLLTKVNLLS